MGLKTQIRRYLSPRAYLTGLVNRRSRRRVLAGPFAGMQYVSDSHGSAFLPKVLGTYERELYGVIGEVIGGDHDLLVDVGAAEGYFAVGLASKCEAPVVAYEMDPRGRALATRLATQNGVVERIDLRGECDPPALEQTLGAAERPFLLIDVEGAEAQLLNSEAVPALGRTTVLVEIHEFARPGITAELLHRFTPTHDVRVIWEEERSADDFPYETALTRLMPKRWLRRAVEEHRGWKQSWLWMTPRDAATSRAAA